jgi:hypothetical protein
LSQIDNGEVGKALGCKKAYSLGYQNHRVDEDAMIEIRARGQLTGGKRVIHNELLSVPGVR